MCCSYDLFMSPLEVVWLRRIREQLCQTLTGEGLDIGAGSGANFPYLDPHLTVTAIEPDEWMRNQARHRLRPHIRMQAGVAESLPMDSHSLDWVLCTLVLCSVQDPQRAVAELQRVLKPDGRLFFLEHVRGPGWSGQLHDWCTPVWSWLVHGCHLNRPTQKLLEDRFIIDRLQRQTIASVPFIFGQGVARS